MQRLWGRGDLGGRQKWRAGGGGYKEMRLCSWKGVESAGEKKGRGRLPGADGEQRGWGLHAAAALALAQGTPVPYTCLAPWRSRPKILIAQDGHEAEPRVCEDTHRGRGCPA